MWDYYFGVGLQVQYILYASHVVVRRVVGHSMGLATLASIVSEAVVVEVVRHAAHWQ